MIAYVPKPISFVLDNNYYHRECLFIPRAQITNLAFFFFFLTLSHEFVIKMFGSFVAPSKGQKIICEGS